MRKQQERLRAYLSMIEAKLGENNSPLTSPYGEAGADSGTDSSPLLVEGPGDIHKELSQQDEAFMNRVVRYVEEHISDADANSDGRADAAATSRSVLFRKMKNIVGLTPADFLREARIKRACQLLKTTQKPISDVAYSCGFSDPKYFSKYFKASTGSSPTEYRSVKEG